MITKKRQFGKKSGFTIVELLTVMSIIVILISLLVPALSKVKQYSKEVVQRKQFASIEVALEMFEAENGDYPDSSKDGSDGLPYCGAMKLAEALIGQDLLGYHPDSTYRSDRMNNTASKYLYLIPGIAQSTTDVDAINVKSRKGPYLPVEFANANRMGSDLAAGYEGIYNTLDYTPFLKHHLVICDVYTRPIVGTGLKAGMPILYYKARTTGTTNPRILPDGITANTITRDAETNIYNYEDNDELIQLGMPWTNSGALHPMDSTVAEGAIDDGLGVTETFYYKINNDDVPLDIGRPYKADSYILISAGYDGEYGTRDDILNFQK